MRPINVVLALHDAAAADCLTASLNKQFRNLLVAKSFAEVKSAVTRFRAPFSVVDLELLSLPEITALAREFPATAFVCVHRLADDRLWTDALAAGAVDCCYTQDVLGILQASERYVVIRRSRGAAA
jgi:hypothetical protein